MIVYLSRKASFSAAHCYWLWGISDEENELRFGKWASRDPHGHNYVVVVTVAGVVDEKTGMVVNITSVNHALKSAIIDNLDGKFLNKEVPFFQTNSSTTENIAHYVWNQLEPELPEGAELTKVHVAETETLWAEREKDEADSMTTTLTRTYDFSASHRLHSLHLTDDQNKEIFGKCNSANGHGHNYGVEVTIIGEPDPKTGMLVSIDEIDRIVEEEVLIPFDHKHLNLDTVEFAETNPTSEMLSVVIWQRLAKRLPTSGFPRLYRIVVNETARNSFEYRGPSAR